ncbi:hypothetical protein D7147_05460 [Micromonospora musae]|uniref:Uncharacterized protein n=1 Tax=Micromonospora musae TaxID=1894970 RepID=A0ABX9REP8_9ACTN|nr:hypothetical protein D7147_05460 [Micromonospora musae]
MDPRPLVKTRSTGSPTSRTTKTAARAAPAPAPTSWPALRNAAIGALRLTGVTNIAAANRHHARDSTRPLALLGIT